MRFQPLSPLSSNELPLTVRSVVRDEGGVALGSEFSVVDPRQYELVADLVFANSDEWVRFQNTRRKDIGVIRGVVEFISLAIFQTFRGLSYLFTSAAPKRPKQRPKQQAPAKAQSQPAEQQPTRRPTFVGADPSAVVTSGSAATAALHGAPVTRSVTPRPDR
jgi:cellulose synthase (UDP-forming)